MDNVSIHNDPLLKAAPLLYGFKVLPPVVLIERLGEGAMGSVYRGRHLNLDIDVAVKCLKAELLAQNPEYVARFQREAKIAASINQENLVRVLDTLQDYDCCYTVMEFVDGETIESRVVRKGALSVEESLSIILPSIRAMAALHERKIVHRDIKPPNIMVSQSGVVKLTDLGIAKEEENKTGTLQTNPQAVMGTPQYMPPEQFENTFSVNDRADVYAMAATLAFMLIGNHAIQGSSMHEILKKVCLNGFPKIIELKPGLPDKLCELITKCTATDPAQRPDARTFAREVTQLLYSMGGEIPLADANASRSYGTGSMPSRLDRSAVQQIRAAVTQSRSTGMGNISGSTVPKTMLESPPSTYRPQQGPGGTLIQQPPEPQRKKSKLPLVLAAMVVVGGIVASAAVVALHPPTRAWAMGLIGQKPADSGGSSSGGTPSGGSTTTPSTVENNSTPSTAKLDVKPIDPRDVEVNQSILVPIEASGGTGALTYSISSSDTQIIAADNARMEPTALKPSIKVQAGTREGISTITVDVADAGGRKGQVKFVITVKAKVYAAPNLMPIAPQVIQMNGTSPPIDLRYRDADSDPAAIKFTFKSDNETLLPPATAYKLNAPTKPTSFTITPARGQNGAAQVTVTATDETNQTNSYTFNLTVNRVIEAPTIARINDVNLVVSAGASAKVPVKIGDKDSDPATLTVTASSSDESLLPASGLVVSGSGAQRDLTVTPAPGKDGSARVTVVVTDSDNQTANTEFGVTVNKPAPIDVVATGLKDVDALVTGKKWPDAMKKLGDLSRNVTDAGRPDFIRKTNAALLAFRAANPDPNKRRADFRDQAITLKPLAGPDGKGSSVAALLLAEYYAQYTSLDPIDIDRTKPDDLKLALEYAELAYKDPADPQYDACVHAHVIISKGGLFPDEKPADLAKRSVAALTPGERANHAESTAWLGTVKLSQASQAMQANGGQRNVESDRLSAEGEAMLARAAEANSLFGMTNYGVLLYGIRAKEAEAAGDVQRAAQLRATGAKYLTTAARKNYRSAQDRCQRFGIRY
jgi:serine/threonine protein kinase